MTKTQLLLSFTLGARNDDYGGNSRWRLEMALNYLATNLHKLGRLSDVEVVITDWGSDIPLYCVLSLTPEARHIVRWVIVPPSLARELEGDSEFPVVLTQNTGIRRSRGTYIAQMDADILVPVTFLQKLFLLLKGRLGLGAPIERALAVAQRRNVPLILAAGNPSVPQLEWVIERFGHLMTGERLDGVPYFGTGFILMHRNLWEECGGFDETLIYRGAMETDLGSRVTRQYPCVLLNRADMRLYHLAHYTFFGHGVNPRKHNKAKPNNLFHPNDRQWGLRQHVLEEYRYGTGAGAPLNRTLSADRAGGLMLTPRVLGAIGAICSGAILRRVVPAPVRSAPARFFIVVGNLRLLLGGKRPRQWPVTLWNYWWERRRRRRTIRDAKL